MNPTPAGGTYSDSVDSLRTSLSFLESSVNTLGEAVSDYPRITSVLKTVRVGHVFPLDQQTQYTPHLFPRRHGRTRMPGAVWQAAKRKEKTG